MLRWPNYKLRLQPPSKTTSGNQAVNENRLRSMPKAGLQ